MTYYWTVALNGTFLFRTDEVTTMAQVLAIRREFKLRFSSAHGYAVTECTRPSAWTFTRLGT